MKKIDFINGDAGKSLLKMVIPLFAAMVLMMAYNLVDSVWVGNLLGESGYAALTTAGAVSMILYALTTGISNGVAIVVSRLVGEGDRKKTDKAISTVMIVSMIFAVSLTVILECFLNRILKVFNTPEAIYGDAGSYLSVFLLGYGALLLYMQITSTFRSFGDPVFQMKGMILGTVINIISDPIFIKAFGIKGAAAASVLSQIICLIYAFLYERKRAYFKYSIKEFSPEMIPGILKTAIPASAQNCFPALSSMIMVILVNRFDVTTIAAYGVVKNVETILFYPAMAMNMALITIVGQLYGAGRGDRIREYMKKAFIIGILLEAALTVLVLIFSTHISMAFVKEEAVAAIVSHGLKIIGIGYICYMITNIYTARMAGMGKTQLSMLLMFFYYLVIRIPLAAVLVSSALELDGLFIAMLISHVVAALLAAGVDKMLDGMVKHSLSHVIM
ncbi:MAG: MATE family efflux transporter [Lachnospiraceae bacterium]|nr:MATE family efflux transporter [Lachnospiraceae bacterium]